MDGRVGVIEEGVAHFQGQLAAVRHGVAGVDGHVQHRVLDLVGVHQRVPQPARDHGLDLDGFAQGPPQHVAHAADDAAQVHRFGLQRLAAGERQQLAGEARAPRHRADGVLQQLAQARIGQDGSIAGTEVQIGADHLQQIVEVMRHAAGQVAHRLHRFCDWRTIPSMRIRSVWSTTPMMKPPVASGRLVDIQLAPSPGDVLGVGAEDGCRRAG